MKELYYSKQLHMEWKIKIKLKSFYIEELEDKDLISKKAFIICKY